MWVQQLLTTLSKDVADGFNKVRIEQVIRADKELFTILANEQRGNIRPTAGGVLPIDVAFGDSVRTQELSCTFCPHPFEKEIHLPNLYFWVPCWFTGVYEFQSFEENLKKDSCHNHVLNIFGNLLINC